MTGAAMCQPLDQIGAAIPFGALRSIRLVGSAPKEQQLPACDDDALIEREGKLVCAGGGVDRLPRHQIGVERLVVAIGDIGEMVVGEGRIEMSADTINAGPHRAAECSLRPPADAGVRIRRDVRGIDRAERRRHRKTAGKGLAASQGVAIIAVADGRKITATLDEFGVERLRRRRLDRRYRRSPGNAIGRNRAADQDRTDDACDSSWLCHPSRQLLLLLRILLAQIHGRCATRSLPDPGFTAVGPARRSGRFSREKTGSGPAVYLISGAGASAENTRSNVARSAPGRSETAM